MAAEGIVEEGEERLCFPITNLSAKLLFLFYLLFLRSYISNWRRDAFGHSLSSRLRFLLILANIMLKSEINRRISIQA